MIGAPMTHAVRGARRHVSSRATRRTATAGNVFLSAPHVQPNHCIVIELLRTQARHALTILSALETRVVQLRFGIGVQAAASVVAVARELRLTSARIRQIEANALRKLRHGGRRRTQNE